MRKLALALGVVAATLAVAPAAQANHVDFNRSTAVCVLENNVPTLKVQVIYVDFEENLKPVSWTVALNGTIVDSGVMTWPASESTHVHTWTRQVDASKTYVIDYDAHWGRGYRATYAPDMVACPQPVPPPSPPVRYDCNGQPLVADQPAPACAPPPPPPVNVTPPPVPPSPCVMVRTHRTRVYAGARGTITVQTTDAPAGTPITLKLPGRKPIIRQTDTNGQARFVFRARRTGYARVSNVNCGSLRAKVRPRKRTTSHRPPRVTG